MRAPSEPVFNLPPVIIWLCGTLIACHLLRLVVGANADLWVLWTFAFIPLRYTQEGLEALPGGAAAWLWTPLTYAFLHGGMIHLVVNVVWMASFGTAVARRFGTGRFLMLSGVAALAGAGAHYLAHSSDPAPVIGASGAVSGMTAAAARFVFAPGGPLAGPGTRNGFYWNPAPPLSRVFTEGRALAFILIWFAVNLLFGLQPQLVPGVEGGIAWEAHVGGFLAGLIGFSLLDPIGGGPPDPLVIQPGRE